MVKYLLTFLMLVSIDRYVSHCFTAFIAVVKYQMENKNTVDVKKILYLIQTRYMSRDRGVKVAS